MKIQSSFCLFVSTAVLCTLGAAYGSERDLVDLMATSLKGSRIITNFELPSALPGSDAIHRKLKRIEAFGINFSGQAAFKVTSLQSVSLWCDDTHLAPNAALRLFSQISGAFRPRIGEGKLIVDVPSFEDASDPKKQVMLWTDGSEVILLSVDIYPTRAGLSLERINRSTWLEEMGTDQSEFWDKTLKPTGTSASASSANVEQPSTQPQSTQAQTTPTSKPSAVIKPPAPTKAPEAKVVTTSEELVSTPWLTCSFVIVAAIGLLSLLLKKQK